MRACNLVVFVSGGGTNLQAIIDNIDKQQLNARVVSVISDKANAYGLERAKNHAIDYHFVDPKAFASKEEYEHELIRVINGYPEVNLIILAGFMRILGATFVDHFNNRILNIHPSLLPKYKGLNTHQRAIENGDSQHGSSVHIVTTKLDDGPILLQSNVAITAEDTVASLQDKIQIQEYIIYSQAIDDYWLALNNA